MLVCVTCHQLVTWVHVCITLCTLLCLQTCYTHVCVCVCVCVCVLCLNALLHFVFPPLGPRSGSSHCRYICSGMLYNLPASSSTQYSLFILLQVQGAHYFTVSAGTAVTQIPVLLIIVGLFTLIFGVVGLVGSVLAGRIVGRIVLGLVRV